MCQTDAFIEFKMQHSIPQNSCFSAVKHFYLTFFSGLQRESGIATWSHMSGSIELKDIAVWANNEPNTDGSNASCAVSQDEGLGLKSCSLKLPFVCKYQACLKGLLSKALTASTQECLIFCQTYKISTHTCIFESADICKLDTISIVAANRCNYLKYHWN